MNQDFIARSEFVAPKGGGVRNAMKSRGALPNHAAGRSTATASADGTYDGLCATTRKAVSCRICGHESHPAFAAAEHRMYRCGFCRSAFVEPMPSPEYLKRFYDHFHKSADEGGWYDDIETRMQADFPAKIALVRRRTNGQPGRLLDIGCGKGFFVKACNDVGIRAEGIDLSASAVEFATTTLEVKATCGVIRDLGVEPRFDTVTLWATIEHLPDPGQMLADIFALLKPGGHLFVDTGAGDDWLDRLLPGLVQWYDPPQHLFVFSAKGLALALQAAGFEVRFLDRCFERTPARRFLRIARNGTLALLLRLSSLLGGMRGGRFAFTRYPLGNVLSAVAQTPMGK